MDGWQIFMIHTKGVPEFLNVASARWHEIVVVKEEQTFASAEAGVSSSCLHHRWPIEFP